jgi:small acid-soluble spore protein A (major alpha-type SASP)
VNVVAQGSNTSNQPLVQGAGAALDQFKYEVARELGLNVQRGDYWGDLPARQCGSVGGQMVRRMIRLAEEQLSR